jgi:hypothetical protein
MTTPLFHISLPDSDGPEHFAPLQIALEGLTKINEWHIARALKRAQKGLGNPIAPLYASGVVYKEDPPGEENWKDVHACIKDGHADCDRLAAWRTAELRVAGIPAEPVLKWQWIPRERMIATGYPPHLLRNAPGVWMVHCLVRWPDGHIEDPSKILGMGGNYTSKI